MGMMMRNIRLNQGIFWITAASSISLLSCIIEFNALRLANGMYLTTPANISKRYVLKMPSEEPNTKKATPTASDGIRYGKERDIIHICRPLAAAVFTDTVSDKESYGSCEGLRMRPRQCTVPPKAFQIAELYSIPGCPYIPFSVMFSETVHHFSG